MALCLLTECRRRGTFLLLIGVRASYAFKSMCPKLAFTGRHDEELSAPLGDRGLAVYGRCPVLRR
jgi:hypothetical protein